MQLLKERGREMDEEVESDSRPGTQKRRGEDRRGHPRDREKERRGAKRRTPS